MDGNKIGTAVLSLAPLCEWEINAISDLTWRRSFITDSLKFQMSLVYGDGGDGSVDGFVAILIARNVALCIARVFTQT